MIADLVEVHVALPELMLRSTLVYRREQGIENVQDVKAAYLEPDGRSA